MPLQEPVLEGLVVVDWLPPPSAWSGSRDPRGLTDLGHPQSQVIPVEVAAAVGCSPWADCGWGLTHAALARGHRPSCRPGCRRVERFPDQWYPGMTRAFVEEDSSIFSLAVQVIGGSMKSWCL